MYFRDWETFVYIIPKYIYLFNVTPGFDGNQIIYYYINIFY